MAGDGAGHHPAQEPESLPAEFRRLLEEDLAAGRTRSLPEYQSLFPGRFREVAGEYRRLKAEGGPRVSAPEPVRTPTPGAAIGPFRLEEEVGRGGQAVVYRAEDTRLGRRVALKVLPAVFAGEGPGLDRLRREARIASRLDHPGIAGVLEAGESDGVAFIAMRFVEGETLARRIEGLRERWLPEQGPADTPPGALRGTPVESAGHVSAMVGIVEKAARALQAAHEAGLVHRDIKPGNLMITPGGDPVLLDFGLAREEDGGGTITRTGSLLGTPAYLAPELIAAGGHRQDARTDVYALGVILHESLTLRLPFEAPTRARLFHLLLTSDPEDPRPWNRALSRDLSVVIRTALARDPDRRYRSAAEFAEDLRRAGAGEPIRARPPGPLRTLARWVRLHPAVAAATLSLAASLTAGLGAALHFLDLARSEGRAKDQALAAASEAQGETIDALARARALALAGASNAEEGRNPTLALLLAREACRAFTGPETLQRLRDALVASRQSGVWKGHLDEVDGLVLHSASGRVLSCSRDNTARLWDADGRCLAVLDGGGGDVLSADFSPGGDLIAIGTESGGVGLFTGDGVPLASLSGHTAAVETVRFSGEGGLLVSASRDGTARVWNRGGVQVSVLRGHRGGLTGASFSPDGSTVLSSSLDGTARLWSPEGAALETLQGHEGEVRTAAFSRSGDRILTASTDGTARLWSTDGRHLRALRPGDGPLRLALFSPDDARVLTLADGGRCRVWNLGATESEAGGLLQGLFPQRQAAFSPRGDRVVAPGVDGVVRVWDSSGALIADLRGHTGRAVRAVFTPDGRRVLTTGWDGTVRVFEADSSEAGVIRVPGTEVRSVSIDSSGDRLLTGCADGTVRLHDPASSSVRVLGEGMGGAPHAFFLEGGARVLAGSPGGPWHLMDPAGGDSSLLGGGESFTSAVPSPAGDRVAALGSGGRVVLFDGAGSVLARVETGGTVPDSLSWSGDSGRWSVGIAAGWTRVFSSEGAPIGEPIPRSTGAGWVGITGDGLALFAITERGGMATILGLDGRTVASLPWPNRFLKRPAFSPSGETCVAAGETRDRLSLRDATGKEVAVLLGHEDTVRCAVFSPDGKTLASGSYDSRIRLWTPGGTPVAVLSGHRGPVSHLAFTPRGDRLLSLGTDGIARLWTLDPGDLLALADSRITRELSAGERLRFADLLGEDRALLAAAQSLATTLLREEWLPDAVHEVLLRDAPGTPELRMWAARFIDEEIPERALSLNDRAWPHVVYRGGEEREVNRALRAARRAHEREPGNLSIRNTLGVALYRAGRLAECLPLLEECEAKLTEGGALGLPDNTAFLAMALQRTGRRKEALAAVDRLRLQMEVPGASDWASNRGAFEDAVLIVEERPEDR